MSMKPSIIMQLCKLTLFFLFITFSARSVSSAEIVVEEFNDDDESEVLYSDYCSSIVPESVPISKTYTHSFGTFDRYETGYYIGGNGILNPEITSISNSFSFQTRYVSKTVADGVWKIKGSLTFHGSYDPITTPFHLNLHGFWSEFSGNLCMVGTGFAYSKQGNLISPSAVFKLRNLRNSSIITTITGTLESPSCSDGLNHFEPISIIMFPLLNYEFSAESDPQKTFPFNELPSRSFCSMILGHVNEYKLEYTSDCSSGKQNCLPFVRLNGYSPRFLSFSSIRCSEVERRLRVLVEFRNTSHIEKYPSLNPNTTLIGEGTWDYKTNQLFVFACQFLNITQSWSNAHVGDCTTRLSFRFSSILSIRETSSTTGKIWTTKALNDSGYFNRTTFRSTGNHMERVPGLKYEYTEFNRVKNLFLINTLDRLDVSSATYKIDQQKISSIWTMDLETTKVLLSNTLMCIFVGFQLYHVNNNPKVLPSISLFMLVILTLGHMIPLALDYETLCSNKQDRNKVSLQNEVIVTVVMVVTFLLLLRLLQLTASSRSHHSNRKSLQFAEEMTLLVIAFLYAAGAKFMLLVAWEKSRPDVALLLSSSVIYQNHSICNYFKSYAGLILDGFLLPQILFNMFSNSKQKALSSSFYVGTTFVRLLPHAYELHCNLSYNILNFSVNLDQCFGSAAWDVAMFWGLLLLAAIIYYQQKFGGHCILPSRFRNLESYPEEVQS